MSDQVGESDCGEVLRAKVCPVCDYSLMGLPAAGVCPECGRGYDTSVVYVYGQATGSQRRAWNMERRGTGQAIRGGVWVLVVGFIYFWPRRRGAFNLPLSVIFFGLIVASYLFSLWRGMGDQGSGVVQVKLMAEGVRQGTRGLGPLPYEGNEKAALVPWRNVREVYFSRKGEAVEMRLSNKRPGFWVVYVYREYVHVGFSCTDEEFAALKKRVREWKAQNGSGAKV